MSDVIVNFYSTDGIAYLLTRPSQHCCRRMTGHAARRG